MVTGLAAVGVAALAVAGAVVVMFGVAALSANPAVFVAAGMGGFLAFDYARAAP